MSVETLFYTQAVSIICFIVALFVLYRLLVSQKEATVQLLKEKSEWLQSQLDIANRDSSDIVLKRLHERIQITNDEINNLSVDKESLANVNEHAFRYISALEETSALKDELIAHLQTGVKMLKWAMAERSKINQEKDTINESASRILDGIIQEFFNITEMIEVSHKIEIIRNEDGSIQSVKVIPNPPLD